MKERRGRRWLRRALIGALGAVLALIILLGLSVTGVIGAGFYEEVLPLLGIELGDDEGEEYEKEFRTPAHVRVQAGAATCYVVNLTGSNIGREQHEACGTRTYSLGLGLDRIATVTMESGPGPVTAVLLWDGKAVERRTTNAQSPTVTVQAN